MMLMQHLAINRTGAYRKETLNGREHYVVPVAMITPGVLKGSKGALYYPPEEIVKNYDAWNGMPLVVNHPTIQGRAVSARTPTVLESHGIGTVLNSRINKNGKLVAEGWFDVEKTRLIDARILNWIEQGAQIELSTGLFTDNIPVKNTKDAVYNGKQYTHVARNYRPDHLAILPDELGACSIKDGCGVGVLNAAKKKKKKKCAACEAMGSGCTCSPTGNGSLRKDAGKLTPSSEKCKGCGKLKTKCECEPVENLSPEKSPTENELSFSEMHVPLEKNLSARFPGAYLNEVYRDYVIFRYAGNLYQLGYSIDKKTDVVSFDAEMPTVVRKVVSFKPVELPSGVAVTNTEAAKMILNESWFKICPRKNGRCLPKSGSTGGKGDAGKGKSGKDAKPKAKAKTAKKAETPPKTVAGEPVTPPSTKKPSLKDTIPGKGKPAKAARVGVSGDEVPPPPKISKLPNLTKTERKVEREFINAYEKDPDGMANKLRKMLKKTTKPGEPLTFGTDDAKVLHKAWGNKKMSLEDRSKNRATLNCALHQTANAVTKRAFVQHLNTLKKGDEVMVTVGGCGAGKGYALKNVPKALELKKKAKAVWDSAGDQNATENTWIQKEAEKRGLKVNYVFVDADPKVQWAHPDRGVVKRAQDPNDGRMVDAKVFADSYAHGAKNHQAFYEKNKNNKNANFIFLENGSNPKEIPGIPKKRLRQSAKKLADFAIETVAKNYDIPPHVRRGATIGTRIWPEGLTANSLLNAAQFILNAADSQEFDDDEDYQEGLDRLNEMADMADDEGFQVGSEPEFDLDENGVEITDDEPTENSSDPLDGLSDTTKAYLILNGGPGSGPKKGSKKKYGLIMDLTSKTGKPLEIKDVVSAFQGVKEGQVVSFTKHGPLGDNNVTEGTVVARYGFNKGFHLQGVGAIDLKTKSGEVKRVSALTQFHRIASADQDKYTRNSNPEGCNQHKRCIGKAFGTPGKQTVLTKGTSYKSTWKGSGEVKIGDKRISQSQDKAGNVFQELDEVVKIDGDTIHFGSGKKERVGKSLKLKFVQNVFSDEARAAALLARKKGGEAAAAVGKAGKAAVVSGVKAAGGAVKAGLKRTGQAYKDVAKELLTRLKNKLGIGMAAGNGKKKPVKMAKDRTKEKQTSKDRYKARLAKIESRLKARKDAKAAKKSANAQRRELKSKTKKNASAIKSRSRQNEAAGKRPLTEPKAKSASKTKTISKESNPKAKPSKTAAKKSMSIQEKKAARYQKDGAKTKAGKRLTQADVDAQRAKTQAALKTLEKQKASIADSKEKLRLANKINEVNAATDKKWKAWGIE